MENGILLTAAINSSLLNGVELIARGSMKEARQRMRLLKMERLFFWRMGLLFAHLGIPPRVAFTAPRQRPA
jgi:hypothetical protein